MKDMGQKRRGWGNIALRVHHSVMFGKTTVEKMAPALAL